MHRPKFQTAEWLSQPPDTGLHIENRPRGRAFDRRGAQKKNRRAQNENGEAKDKIEDSFGHKGQYGTSKIIYPQCERNRLNRNADFYISFGNFESGSVMRWFCFFLLATIGHADFSSHLRKDLNKKTEKSSIAKIDFIYLINLDQRPKKLERCLTQLKSYDIFPHRFSAIYGWDLPPGVFNDVGVKFSPGMRSSEWVIHFPAKGKGEPESDFLRAECIGKTVFSRWMTPGDIGCSLSHLSVLQDAVDSGYETIWVMEDDILLEKDPHLLSSLIEKLDAKVGKEGWDVLYTDLDSSDSARYTEENDFQSDLKGDLWFFWRPDMNLADRTPFAKRTVLSEDFIKIGSRFRTHSMIIRRSGMKKILDFEKKHHLFIPYDHELAIVPHIQLFSLRYNLATHEPSPSDTQTNPEDQQVAWEVQKSIVLSELPKIPGWYTPQNAGKIMDFIRETRPKICVEIGAFGGRVTYPIASALQFLKTGTLFAIDAWDQRTAVEGLEKKNADWWKAVDMDSIRQQFLTLISSKQLHQCHPVHKTSQEAVSSFADESIDFLFLDGAMSKKGSLEDVRLYLPKVRPGGYIWLNNASFYSKNESVAFLMNHCKWIKEKSIGIDCVLFQKK
jgi:GR25 family glycosyltransferase involved in LPS biosynthesis